MGPVLVSLPQRPKFSWDIKSAPWTDGAGPQDGYAHAVRQWCRFHDALPAGNSNRIDPSSRGIVLEACLYGRAKDVCKSLTPDQLMSEHGVEMIIEKVHQRDALSVLNSVYRDFNTLLNTKRGASESLRGFELRFNAQLARFNSNGSDLAFHESITALMLLLNANVDDSHRVSILSSIASTADVANLTVMSPNFAFIENVSYNAVSSILRQCDRPNSTVTARSTNVANAGASRVSPRQRRIRATRQKKGNGNAHTERISALKARTRCRKCGKYGHWEQDHEDDGSLDPSVPCFDRAQNTGRETANRNPHQAPTVKSETMNFGLALPISSNDHVHDCGSSSDHDVDDDPPQIRLMSLPQRNHRSAPQQQDIARAGTAMCTDDPIMCVNNETRYDEMCIEDDKPLSCADDLIAVSPNDISATQNLFGINIDDWMCEEDYLHMPPLDLSLSNDVAPINTLESGMADCMPYAGSNSKAVVPLGPMVDDGAPYSAIGLIEIELLLGKRVKLQPMPKNIRHFKFWQFGSGDHASRAKPILGTKCIMFKTDSGRTVSIRHLVVSGSSPWIVGRNVTSRCDIIHVSDLLIRFPFNNGDLETISLVNHRHHSYVPFSAVCCNVRHASSMTKLAGFGASVNENETGTTREWKTVKAIIDRVHHHVCGHAQYSDMRTLLQRNGLWSEHAERYLTSVVNDCLHCIKSCRAKPNRKVSLNNIDSSFNENVHIDHFFIEDCCIFHAMDVYSRYSAVHIVKTTSMSESISAFQACWLNTAWTPSVIQGDMAFDSSQFREFVKQIGAKLQLTAPRRHSKNMAEPKHGVIRGIFLRLRSAEPNTDASLLIYRAVQVSNDLYGNDCTSAFELRFGMTKPVDATMHPKLLPAELEMAHHNLVAKRKLNRILRSKATVDAPLHVGDLVQPHIKGFNGKRGKWLNPRQILSIDQDARMVTLAGRQGKTMKVAFEDVKVAPPDDDYLMSMIYDAIEIIDEMIEDSIISSSTSTNPRSSTRCSDCPTNSHGQNDIADDHSTEYVDHVDSTPVTNVTTIRDTDDTHLTPITQPTAVDDTASQQHAQTAPGTSAEHAHAPEVGDAIEVFWPDDNQFYRGVVTEVTNDGEHVIVYDDGDIEFINAAHEQWRPASESHDNDNNGGAMIAADGDNDEDANDADYTASAAAVTTLQSNEQQELAKLHECFGVKPFLLHEAQGFCQAALQNAYKDEEDSFKKTVKCVSRSSIPTNANVITSHVIYKIKVNDDDTFKLKARIAPHGNKDQLRSLLRSDCSVCSPLGMRVVMTYSTLMRWPLHKADVKSAFLQTGPAMRDVYVCPPRESADRSSSWLLLTAAYGLVNANAKWQTQSDALLRELGLRQFSAVPQLFYIRTNDATTLLLAKIVDDFLITGVPHTVKNFLRNFNEKFRFGTISSGPGVLRFYGLRITQDDDMSSSIDGDEKLTSIEMNNVSRARRGNPDAPLSAYERSDYLSVCASINWLGMTTSPLCAFYSSFLQQKLPDNKVTLLALQSHVLRKLKMIGTSSVYPPPPMKSISVSVVVFADAGRIEDHGQLSYLTGLLLGPLDKGSHFYVLSWTSHKSKRPIRSTAAAEILAVGEGIDEGKVIKSIMQMIFNRKIKLMVITDSKDLFTSLSTQRNSIDKSIRPDVNVIRYEFQTKSVDEIVWLPGKVNLADPGTKRDSALTDTLMSLLHTGRIPVAFDQLLSKSYDRSLG